MAPVSLWCSLRSDAVLRAEAVALAVTRITALTPGVASHPCSLGGGGSVLARSDDPIFRKDARRQPLEVWGERVGIPWRGGAAATRGLYLGQTVNTWALNGGTRGLKGRCLMFARLRPRCLQMLSQSSDHFKAPKRIWPWKPTLLQASCPWV